MRAWEGMTGTARCWRGCCSSCHPMHKEGGPALPDIFKRNLHTHCPGALCVHWALFRRFAHFPEQQDVKKSALICTRVDLV